MNVLQPKKSYKLNYIAVIPPIMGILSEIGVWMPILNVFSIFLGIMGIAFGIWYITKLKKSTKRKISEFGLIALGNMTWIVAMLVCAFMKFSSASYDNSTSNDFLNQLTGFGYTDRDSRTQENGSGKADNTQSENTKSNTGEKSQKNTENSKSNYDIGDTVKLENVKITLKDVQKNFKMPSEYSGPKQGSQFVKVTTKIENISESEISVSENDMKIIDSKGAMENPTSATYILNDQFESAVLIPEGIREGAVIFEVPENDDGLKLIYHEPGENGQKIEFDL